MAKKERKYAGALTLGTLEIACEAEEQSYGEIEKLEALGGWTIATYDDESFPSLNSLAFLPTIGGAAPPSPPKATHLFNGRVTVLGVEIDVAVYRTS